MQFAALSNNSKINGNKTRRKLHRKLHFHRRTSPIEYLDHYEASLAPNKSEINAAIGYRNSSTGAVPVVEMGKIKTASSPNNRIPCSTVKYKDLPYMGEITLDNAKPRRGRKPKKADICHLIYKNYNTTVVEEPLNLCLRDSSEKPIPSSDIGDVSFRKFKLKGELTPISREKKITSKGSTKTTLKLSNKNRRSRETKVKNKKSLAREKLERTFKERGFLIQTEQLESTHGVTYCKFRQLRKFTRYLFRSWKHHLPGDVVKSNLKL